MLWSINPSFPGLFSSIRQIVYALRTRTPLVSDIAILLPFDLHVLGLPLAFILSQDQTLHCKRVRSLFVDVYLPLPKLGQIKNKEKKNNKYDKLCYLFWFLRIASEFCPALWRDSSMFLPIFQRTLFDLLFSHCAKRQIERCDFVSFQSVKSSFKEQCFF